MLTVSLFIAKTLKDCHANSKSLHFDEELLNRIYKDKTSLPAESQILFFLDPYGIESLSVTMNIELLEASKLLQVYYADDEELTLFLNELEAFCSYAIYNNEAILSVGD